jgi:CheY-like chemotaxis protein
MTEVPHRVLVIDDDEQIRLVMRRALERAGYVFFEVADGSLALAATRQHRPDVVVTDIIMPEKEGIETIRELQREFPDLAIIAMSGGGRIDHHTYLGLARKLGAVATLAKPFLPQDLIATLREVLGQSPPSAA